MPNKKNGAYIYSEDEKNKEVVDSIEDLSDIENFVDTKMQGRFGSFIVLALNDSKDAYETNDGRLCNGYMAMQLGTEEDYQKNSKNEIEILGRKMKVSRKEYQDAMLASALTHIIRAHTDDEKDAERFAWSLAQTIKIGDKSKLSKEEMEQRSVLARGMRELEETLLDECDDTMEALVLLNSTIAAVKLWKSKENKTND